jgi:hypothetical protein
MRSSQNAAAQGQSLIGYYKFVSWFTPPRQSMHPSQAAAWAPWAGRSAWLCVCRMRLWHPAVAVGLALGSCQALENGVGRTPMM